MPKEYSIFNTNLKFYPINFFQENKIDFDFVETPKVSIIIPVYNEILYTLNCLYSLRNNIQNIDYEIIIVNDNSKDNTIDYLNKISNLKIINNETNFGFLKNVNKALKVAKGEFILIFNNDILVLNNFLKHLLDVFDNNPDVGAVGSMLIYENLTLQEAGALIQEDGNCINLGRERSPYTPEYNYLREVDYCSGCCLLTRRFFPDGKPIFLDEYFLPAYYEETDLCMRLKYEYNLKIMYQPWSKIIHFESISYGNQNKQKINLLNINKEKFLIKWSKFLKNNIYPEKILIIIETSKNPNFEEIIIELKKHQQRFHVVYYSKKIKQNNLQDAFRQEGIQISCKFKELKKFIKTKPEKNNCELIIHCTKINLRSIFFKNLLKVNFLNRKNIFFEKIFT